MMSNTETSTPIYPQKIDTQGNYLPFPGYTIVSHAIHPLPKSLIDLVNHLSSSELQKYYSFLPATSYHVTINPLENVLDEHKALLQNEQHKLNGQDTRIICTAEKLLHSRNISLEVQFKDDENQTFQNIIKNVRSNELQQANILPNHTRVWHLTLAYKYRDIENNEVQRKLDQIFENIPQSSKFPFDIPLNHIRICHFNDMTKFTPI